MNTFDQINDATGFANGDKWMTDEQIYDYFTTENMRRMFRDQATLTQDELDEMAEAVIENRWHMEADSEPTCDQIAALQDEATTAANGRGLHYRSAEWQRLAECVSWQGIWPVIDADGELTGEISEGSESELNVDDEAMIDADDARAGGWKIDAEEGRAYRPTVAVEFAVADETIRTCAIDDLIGLEHTAAAEACEAYRRAAVDALEADDRAGRLRAERPRGQRIVHSQWAGAGWSYSAGAIGTMAQLTDDEKAAVSAADDAGRRAAQAIVDAAETV